MTKCDFCSNKAAYDVKIFGGGWAYVCSIHYHMRENDVQVTPL